MEPVGIQGLLPLMPSIPSVVPVAIPESGGDPPESTLTELVPVRTAKQTTAAECLLSGEASQEGSSSTITEERTAADPLSDSKMQLQQTIRSGPAIEALSPDGTPYIVPPHLMGRSLENPSGDPVNTGRRPQKPRLGVRVPHRNLTSQIVSQNELAQELLERSMKKLPLTPDEFRLAKSSGYPFFTQKLAERLSKTLAPAASKMETSTLRSPSVPLKVGNTPSVSLKVGYTPSVPLKKPAPPETPRLSPGFTHIEKPPAGGDAELLSILEGDGDPLWLPDKLVKKEVVASLPTVPNLPRSNLPPPIVLDPILERELALKQLEELPVREHKRKSKGEKTEEPKKKRVYKRKRDQMESSVDESSVVNGEEGSAAPSAAASTPANRKRKLSPDVAAVLKKPPAKVKKTVKAVPNGKAPKGVPKKTPKVVLKKKGAKATKAPVANGTAATAASAKGTKRGRRSKKDEPEGPEKVEKKATPAQKKKPQTPAKSAKQTTPPASAAKRKSEPAPLKQEVSTPEQEEGAEKSTVEIDLPEGQGELDVPNVGAAASVSQEATKPEQQSGPSRVSELDRLLGDEGAVNLLFDVDGSTSSGAPSRRSLPSKDLALRARLVKTAVLRLSQTSQGHVPLALRARRSLAVNAPPRLSRMGGEPRRQSSVDSRDAHRSPPSLTPMDVSPNHRGVKYVDHSRMKLTADASRIIRRHSSSSTFSSPSVSPRRVSVDLEHPDGDTERVDGTAMTPGARKKGVPIFVRDKETTYSGKKKSRMVNPAAVDSTALSLSESARKLLELQVKDMKVKKTLVPNPAALKKKDLKKISSQVKNKVKSEMFKNFKKGLDGAVVIAAKKAVATKLKRGVVVEALRKAEEIEVDRQNCSGSRQSTPPPSTSKVNPTVKKEGDKAGIPLSPDASSYSNLIKTLKHDQKSRRVVEDRQRASMRHCAGTYTYRELTVRRYDKVVHIIMAPVSTKIRSGINVQVLRELRDALHQVKKDDSCRVVLLTSAGASFCQGIDVSCLLHNNVDKRKAAAIDMIVALKDFLKCLASFPKPVIAGVHGPTVGLGVTMLPLFDMVFASDKATFHTPYARLGQVPEGAATLTLPYMLGYTLTSELLLGSREMTAAEALNCGLVTRTLWPDRFLEELVPLVKSFASQSAQSMEATKALLRHGLRTKFDAALESESHLLVTHWTSNECQDALRRWLESGSVALQRPRLPDA